MSHTLPLLGKRILVPRGKKDAKSFSAVVEKYGGIPVEIPLLAFRPISLSKETEKIIKTIDTYDWIIFTSNVTVETFLSFFPNCPRVFPKIAVIGNRTKAVLAAKGYEVHFVPNEYVAEGFVRDFLPLVKKGMKILIPKGNLARDIIAESFREERAIVDEMIVYETYLPNESKLLLKETLSQNQLDILSFTSPSTVDHFMEVVNEYQLQRNIVDCLISCIGPVTRDRLESVGLRVDAMPSTYTVEDMIKEIIKLMKTLS